MKKIAMILICMLLISKVACAQYKFNKKKYDYRSYTYQGGDLYNPSVAGLTSFLIPGLGQMISGEAGRGAAFLGGFAGGAIMIVAGVNLSNTYTESEPGNEGSIVLVAGLVTVGLISMIGVDIWAGTDAKRVAKVNNLAFRDKNKTGYNLEVNPYIGSFRTKNIPVGLSLRVRF